MSKHSILTALAALLLLYSTGPAFVDDIFADRLTVVRNGDSIESAYAYYRVNGEIDRITVRVQTVARIPIVIPYTYTGIEAETARKKYGF